MREISRKGRKVSMLFRKSVSHAGGVDLFPLFLFVGADAVDDGERDVGGVRVPDAHGVVLVGQRGADAGMVVEDVGEFKITRHPNAYQMISEDDFSFKY